MEIFRFILKRAALGMTLTVLATTSTWAQNYDNHYNDNRGYNNSGYDSRYNYDGYQDYDDDNNTFASMQDFYDALSPYGDWINDPDYGYVWVPDVNRNFRPYYTNGYWAQTEYGNTWVSGYDWGWAPFHYGRWTYDNSYGWVWIPGTEWAPAWVNWRAADNGYYGWAPMGPGYDVDYYASNNNFYGPSNWWVFAPQQYLYSSNFYNYVRSPRYNNDYLRRSRFLNVSRRSNGYRYFAGPRRVEIERATGRTINTYRLGRANRPGVTRITSGNINIYRPRISNGRTNTRNGNIGVVPSIRPQSFRTGRLNIQQGGARRPSEIDRRGTAPQNQVWQLEPRRRAVEQQPSVQGEQEFQRNNSNDNAVPRRRLEEQQRFNTQREQQRNNEPQLRQAQRDQQRNIQLAQEQQRMQQMEQQRAQQEQQRAQQQQQRAQIEQQRAQQQQAREQQMQQQRAQMEQQRAQQAQIREQQRAQQEQQRAQQQQEREQQRVREVRETPQQIQEPRRDERPARQEGTPLRRR